jgi:copper chaperone CopZ
MNVTLIIDEYGEKARLITDNEGDIRVNVIDPFHRLRKWDTLIKRLDREYGSPILGHPESSWHNVIGEDTKNHSYKTFQYPNSVWIHTEPLEFLIDIRNDNANVTVEEIKQVVQSAGYEVNNYFPDSNRLSIRTPF